MIELRIKRPNGTTYAMLTEEEAMQIEYYLMNGTLYYPDEEDSEEGVEDERITAVESD